MKKVAEKISKDLTEACRIQFDSVKDALGLTYEKDFNAFTQGYLFGVLAALKPVLIDEGDNSDSNEFQTKSLDKSLINNIRKEGI